jgi:hypothetical protein
MHPAYFEVRFRHEGTDGEWPDEFAVITAYATTGEIWSVEMNHAADRELGEHLSSLSSFVRRLTGYSPETGHAEPGWAVAISFETACDVGLKFKQDAVYFVRGGDLFVSHCDGRRGLVFIGGFKDILDGNPGEI